MSHPALSPLPKNWFHHGEHVLALLEQYQPKVIVELGSYLGGSAIAMARVARAWGGTIYCVDTWCGRTSLWNRRPFRVGACATNLTVAKVSESCRLIVGRTQDVAQHWHGPAIDFLFVDADHAYEPCKADLAAWWPHVRSGGIVAGDDYDNPLYPGVNQAWDEWEQEHGMPLQRVLTENTNPPGMSLVWGIKP